MRSDLTDSGKCSLSQSRHCFLHFYELLCFVYSESHVICSCSEAFSFTHMLLATFTTMQTRQWRCLNYNDNNNPHHLHSLITSACFTTYENKLVLHSTVVSLSVHYAHIGVHTRKAGNFLHCLHRIQKCTLIIFQHIRGWSFPPPPPIIWGMVCALGMLGQNMLCGEGRGVLLICKQFFFP